MRFRKLVLYFLILFNFFLSKLALSAGKAIEYPDKNWSFSSIFGTFDKASAQRGFQVYKEVCAGCHGMRLISYRNLAALGYNQDELKAIASQFEITDGPNDDGEFFTLDLEDRVINLLRHILIKKQQLQQMVELILQICH